MNRDILLDFDGVIIDSMSRIRDYMKLHEGEISWKSYLVNLDWYRFLRECKSINGSLAILKDMQYCCNIKAIITKVNSENEGNNKIKYLRELGIFVPVILVPYEHRKIDYYYPSNKEILVDDSLSNIKEWNSAGGTGILFDPDYSLQSEYTINNLNKVLKKNNQM